MPFALGAAHQFFGAEGGLKHANVEGTVRGVGTALAEAIAGISIFVCSQDPDRERQAAYMTA
jgi:hypothetical protein